MRAALRSASRERRRARQASGGGGEERVRREGILSSDLRASMSGMDSSAVVQVCPLRTQFAAKRL